MYATSKSEICVSTYSDIATKFASVLAFLLILLDWDQCRLWTDLRNQTPQMLSRPKSSHPVSLNQSELSSLECPRNHPQSAQSLQPIDASEFWATTQFNTARQQETTNEFRTKSFVITSTIQYDFLPKTPLLSSRSSRTARGQHTWLQASNTMVGVIQSRVVV